ncbi:MAG: CHRD domain-containing protein [Chitinophagales bacterium]
MKKFFTILSLLIVVYGSASRGAHLSGNLTMSASLTGDQEAPPVVTAAMGYSSFVLNAAMDTLCIHATFTGLSGAVTGTHIHEGSVGVSGGVILDLTASVNGNDLTATITGSNLALLSISKMLSGEYYLNVHTAVNPDGEIRGQIYLETDYAFTADMNGSQEVPSVTTSAYGLGVFYLYQDSSTISFRIIVQGLSDTITGAHLHIGAPGVSGPVIVDLTAMITGNVIEGEIDSLTFLADLLAGNIYVNVHTDSNPGGEIRGQLLWDKKLSFDFYANGAQEVPAVSTTALGVGSVKLNAAMDSLFYVVVSDGLTDTATGAHFHLGALGVAGGVVIDVTPDISGNSITGVVSDTLITPSFIRDLLSGKIYFNIHTAANPGGEIRGQVYRYAREGYTFTINGAQENPPTSSAATGSGFATIDRNQESAHIAAIVNGLTGTVTGAHIHNNVIGQNGAVIFDLTPWLMQSGNSVQLSGWWTDQDATPFNAGVNKKFINDSVYINYHTASFPDGEVRGQIIRGADCFSTIVGISEIESLISGHGIFPNPADDQVSVQINSSSALIGKLQVMDMTGRIMLEQGVNVTSGISNHKLNLTSLKNGLYLIRIQSVKGNFTIGKFIKD